jgi:PIN domain nuclease of toxin-antitoxin system
MTYLLDTQTFLWLLRGHANLPRRVQEIAEDRTATLALSIVTPWEMSIKVKLGRLDAADILDQFERVLTLGGYTILETTPAQAIRSGSLPRHHRDPFDRLIVAQALDLHIPIISRDDTLDRYGVKRIWE